MGDHSRSNSHDLLHILGFASLCKTCKSFLSKCYPEKPTIFLKKPSNKPKTKPIEDDIDPEFCRFKIRMPTKKHHPGRDIDHSRHHDDDGGDNDDDKTSVGLFRLSRKLSRSRRSHTMTRAEVSKSMSRRDAAACSRSLSRTASRAAAASPIIFSSSSGLMKPPPMEKPLDYTLEELCFGCIKKTSITRDVVTDNGQIVEEEEMVTIKVEPGWRKGTKITFEGKGNQRPGTEAGDVIFVIAEKEHSMFKRREDDLQLGVEIQLVDALTGCTLLLPLLDGETTSLAVEEIVHPGYQRAIEGEGMPMQHEPGRRGNLIVDFYVKFPEALTQDQRSNAATILRHPT